MQNKKNCEDHLIYKICTWLTKQCKQYSITNKNNDLRPQNAEEWRKI